MAKMNKYGHFILSYLFGKENSTSSKEEMLQDVFLKELEEMHLEGYLEKNEDYLYSMSQKGFDYCESQGMIKDNLKK